MVIGQPFILTGIAVVCAVFAALVNMGDEAKRRPLGRAVRVGISAILVFVSTWALWQAQEKTSQMWSSQVVFDAKMDQNKDLLLENRGDVSISDILVHATVYRLKVQTDDANHMTILGVNDFSKVSKPLAQVPFLKASDRKTVHLGEFSNILPFYQWDTIIRESNPRHRAFSDVYCFRVSLRNDITKKRYSYYLLTAPWKGTDLPPIIDPGANSAIAGPVDMKWFDLRATIRNHQAELFDEVEDHRYVDADIR